MVDRAALEMRCTGNCTGGSNPSLSATNAKNQQIAKQTLGFTLFDVKPSVLFTSNSIPTTYGLHTQRFVHFSV